LFRNNRRIALLVGRSSGWFAVATTRGHSFLDGSYVDTDNRNARVAMEPYNNSGCLRIETRMIGAGDDISPSTGSDDRKWLEWSGLQMLANISNHARNLAQRAALSKWQFDPGEARFRLDPMAVHESKQGV